MPSEVLTNSLIVLAAGGFAVRMLLSRGRTSSPTLLPQHNAGQANRPNRDIEQMLIGIAKDCWPAGTSEKPANLEFQVLTTPNDLELFVMELLKHIRKVAPKLSVPETRPRISIEGTALGAGQFAEMGGWVKISVNSSFLLDLPASRAILCHEACHYVLNANGIHLPDNVENERLTDVAMIAFGLGGIFQSGYRRVPKAGYRAGHRLGYLSDEEYAYARERALQLWRSGEWLPAKLTDVQQELTSTIPDENARSRLLEFARSKFPAASELELIEQVLVSYRADMG